MNKFNLEVIQEQAQRERNWVLYDLASIALADQDAQVVNAVESAEEETIRQLQKWAMDFCLKAIQKKVG